MTSHSCQIKFHSNCWFHKYDPIGPHFSPQNARSLLVSRSFISSSSNFEDTSSEEEGETRQWQAVRWIYDWKQWNIQRDVVKEKRRRIFSRNSSRSSRTHIGRRETKNGREKRSGDQNLIKKSQKYPPTAWEFQCFSDTFSAYLFLSFVGTRRELCAVWSSLKI